MSSIPTLEEHAAKDRAQKQHIRCLKLKVRLLYPLFIVLEHAVLFLEWCTAWRYFRQADHSKLFHQLIIFSLFTTLRAALIYLTLRPVSWIFGWAHDSAIVAGLYMKRWRVWKGLGEASVVAMLGLYVWWSQEGTVLDLAVFGAALVGEVLVVIGFDLMWRFVIHPLPNILEPEKMFMVCRKSVRQGFNN